MCHVSVIGAALLLNLVSIYRCGNGEYFAPGFESPPLDLLRQPDLHARQKPAKYRRAVSGVRARRLEGTNELPASIHSCTSI
jgi:hypothetical protein